jgi:hypothetical protein
MSKSQAKTVKPKGRVARKGGGDPPAGGDGAATEKKPDAGPLAKGAQAQAPAVAMPLARAPRVTKPGDAEEVEADKVAARVAAGEKTGPVDQTPATAAREPEQPVEGTEPTLARKVDTETPPPVEQLPVATKPAGEEHKPVARAATGTDAPPDAAPAKVTDAIAAPGQGRPLAPDTRETIERKLPVDLRGVRVHDDAAAQDAARAIDARAFTHGSDIWLGHGESDRDVGLMAHEAAHVAQQAGKVAPSKAKAKKDGPVIERWEAPAGSELESGYVDTGKLELAVGKLAVPEFKVPFSSGPDLKRHERPAEQIKVWMDQFDKPETKLPAASLTATPIQKDTAQLYYLHPKADTENSIIGTWAQVAERAARPNWDRNGAVHFYDVDHQREIQLGGENVAKNLWLLDSKANRSSGSVIRNQVRSSIKKVLDAASKTLTTTPDVDTVRTGYTKVTAINVVGGAKVSGTPTERYDATAISAGESLKALRDMTQKEREDAGGTPDLIPIYERPTGGRHRTARRVGSEWKLEKSLDSKTLKILSVEYDPIGKTGVVNAHLFRNLEGIPHEAKGPMAITPMPGVEYGGYVSSQALAALLAKDLHIPPLSEMGFDSVAFDWEQGIVASGTLIPSVPLLDKLGIELNIDGTGVYLSRTFAGGELAFPGPIKVTGSALEVSFGTGGFKLAGQLPFVVERLGEGEIHADAKVSADGATFELAGSFDFDTELFEEASVHVGYKDGKFSGGGTLKIGPKKLKGVKSATIKAAIDEDRIEAAGDVVMDIPGVEKGAVTLVYDKTTGVEIGGTLQLSNSIPALKSGTIAVKVRRAPEGPWAVSGDIEATAGVPGITATIKGRYEDGAFEVFGSVGYERGMLKGTVDVGATNRPVGEDGRPAGEPTDKLVAFGRGEVTVRLAKWLQGTVGLQVLPNGQMVVSGKIGLPSTLDLFDQKAINKRIFEINLDIPIVGFSVLGQRVGIFATIGGGLDANASIGPGQLRKAELGVTYNPDDEAATHVTGGAELFIPATAGLRLFVSGAVGAGIPIVSAKVGLEVGAGLGLDAALQSTLQVDWTPSKGLVLDAELSSYVQPKFTFDLTAFAKVEVDYLFGSSTLYDERWKLKQFEYGSNLRFGVKFPVHYEEGKAFDVALSDVQFEYPQIDAGDLLKGLVKSIV